MVASADTQDHRDASCERFSKWGWQRVQAIAGPLLPNTQQLRTFWETQDSGTSSSVIGCASRSNSPVKRPGCAAINPAGPPFPTSRGIAPSRPGSPTSAPYFNGWQTMNHLAHRGDGRDDPRAQCDASEAVGARRKPQHVSRPRKFGVLVRGQAADSVLPPLSLYRPVASRRRSRIRCGVFAWFNGSTTREFKTGISSPTEAKTKPWRSE